MYKENLKAFLKAIRDINGMISVRMQISSHWRRKWKPIPVFLSGESHEQRSLSGYSSRDHKGSDRTEMTYHVEKSIPFTRIIKNTATIKFINSTSEYIFKIMDSKISNRIFYMYAHSIDRIINKQQSVEAI